MKEQILFVGMAIFLLAIVVVWFTRFFDEMGAEISENRFVFYLAGLLIFYFCLLCLLSLYFHSYVRTTGCIE